MDATAFQVLQAVLNVFLVIGPTGAGKTTLLRALLRQGFFPGKVARIYNDDGSQDDSGNLLIDAGAPVEGETLEPLMAGCFGCKDESSFFAVMDKIRAANCYTWVVIDPLGFVSGDEVTGVVHEWAKKAHARISLKVLGVLNAAEIEEARVLGVLDSQLAVTNVGIALNRVPEGVTSIEDERLAGVLEVIDASEASAPVFLLSEDLALPDSVRASVHGRGSSRFRLKVSHADHDHSKCGHDHHHDHGHDDDHAHGHAQHVRLHFLLRPGLYRRAVVEWFDRYFERTPDHGVFRMKGSASDLEVQRGFKAWGDLEAPATTQQPFLTLYVKETGSATLKDFVEIMAPTHSSGLVHGSTRALLRRSDLSAEENDRLVRWIMNHLPQRVVMVADGPVTNPELGELLNEVRKRPGVHPALNAEAIRRRVNYYLECVRTLRPDSPYWNAPGAAERKRMLAVGIGWFCQCRSQDVGEEVLRRASTEAGLILRLLVDGLMGIERHHADLVVALEMAREVTETIRFLRKVSPSDLRGSLAVAINHLHTLTAADGRAGLVEAWNEVLNP